MSATFIGVQPHRTSMYVRPFGRSIARTFGMQVSLILRFLSKTWLRSLYIFYINFHEIRKKIANFAVNRLMCGSMMSLRKGMPHEHAHIEGDRNVQKIKLRVQ